MCIPASTCVCDCVCICEQVWSLGQIQCALPSCLVQSMQSLSARWVTHAAHCIMVAIELGNDKRKAVECGLHSYGAEAFRACVCVPRNKLQGVDADLDSKRGKAHEAREQLPGYKCALSWLFFTVSKTD